jgi:hypothetical protein
LTDWYTCPSANCGHMETDEEGYQRHIESEHPELVRKQKGGHFWSGEKKIFPRRLEQ